MGDILLAYNTIGKEEIFDVFEKEILENKLGKVPSDIYDTLNAYAHTNRGSVQLYEYFEKIIGKNINAVKDE